MVVKFIGVLHSLGCTKFKHRADMIHTKKKHSKVQEYTVCFAYERI